MSRTVSRGRPLKGEVRVPGDKSVSHRALILGAMADGETIVEGLAPGADVRSTRTCLEALGVHITDKGTRVLINGRGFRGLCEPAGVLDAGNSGTTMRLLMGALAGGSVTARLSGDDSLRRRPMGRVAAPLRVMGASIDLSEGDRAPVTIRGAALRGIRFVSPVASAQVKSAVLLAGLLAEGETSVVEPVLSRDHTERLLPRFGARPRREGLSVTVTGGTRLTGAHVHVPGDVSSAAFWAVAATLVPGSELHLVGVGTNPTRAGFIDVLRRMGAELHVRAAVPASPDEEPVSDILVRASSLRAADIAAREVPALIDEVPILALAATQARGTSRFRGLAELRVKESDRLKTVAELLDRLGGKAAIEGDDLVVTGPTPLKGAKVSAEADHRIAMTAMVAGAVAEGETTVSDGECAEISYPLFYEEFSGALKR